MPWPIANGLEHNLFIPTDQIYLMLKDLPQLYLWLESQLIYS